MPYGAGPPERILVLAARVPSTFPFPVPASPPMSGGGQGEEIWVRSVPTRATVPQVGRNVTTFCGMGAGPIGGERLHGDSYFVKMR